MKAATPQSGGDGFARFCLIVVAANTVSGAIVGLLARLAMTLITLAGGFSDNFAGNTFTLDGTLRIVLVPILQGLPMAALVVGLRRFIPGTGWRKLLMYGVITFVFPGLLGLTDRSLHASRVNQYVGVSTFASIYFLYGLLMGVVVERLDKRLSPS